MSDIYKYFAIVLFSLVCNSLFCDEPEDHKYISVLDKPFFSFTSSERQITLEGETSSFPNSSEFTIQFPIFELNSNKTLVSINSKKAIYNKDIGSIKFKDSVELQALNKENNLIISSEEIFLNLTNKTFSSAKNVLTNINDLKIKSLGIEITQVAGNLHAEFSEGSFQIKNVGSTTRGYGKKIYINSEDDKIILEEQAQLDQDGFVIKSDLIHYDYNLNKILKSINSSIENNL